VPESYTREAVYKDGAKHGMLVLNLKMTNYSPFPGFVDKAEIIALNPTTKSTTAKVTYIAKKKLYWCLEKKIQLRIATIVPIADAGSGVDPEFRLQLYDNAGQEVGSGPYNLKIVSR
jgi:hypothetical protein